MNIFSNFCPSKIVTCRFKDKPWMTREIKQKLNEKSKVYKKYVKSGFDLKYKQELQERMLEASNLVIASKEKHFQQQGKNLLDPYIGPKRYWPILNKFLQKTNIPVIPPIWVDDHIVNDYS